MNKELGIMGRIISVVRQKQMLFAVLFLFIIGLAVYANSFPNQLFWDDDDGIVNNVYIKDWRYLPKFFSENLIAGAGQATNYWRPLVLISFALDYRLWGLNPWGYHLANIILHILAACLAFWLLMKISQRSGLSFLVALLFLVHPLNTEAVTYVSGRADLLAAVFVLLSLIFYYDFRKQFGASGRLFIWGGSGLKLWLSLVFFVLALLSKEQAFLLPALIILLEFVVISKDQINFSKKLWLFLLYVLLAVIYLILHFTVFNFNHLLTGMDYDLSDSYNASIFVRILTFAKVMVNFWSLLLAPFGLHMAREVAPIVSIFSWPVLIFLVLLIALTFVAGRTWRQDRLVALGIIWYFIWLLPRTNILQINRPMYEHWLYLPMIGFWLALLALPALAWKKFNIGPVLEKRLKAASLVVIIIYICILGFLTIKRNQDWHDPIVFYEKNLRYTPNSYIQHNNLGMAYAARGNNERAIAEYRQAITIKDVYAQVHYNLANCLKVGGDLTTAALEYNRAIAISPSWQFPYQGLLSIYVERRERNQATEVLKQIEKNLDEKAYLMLAGLANYNFGDYSQALVFWWRLLEIEPGNHAVRELISQVKQHLH